MNWARLRLSLAKAAVLIISTGKRRLEPKKFDLRVIDSRTFLPMSQFESRGHKRYNMIGQVVVDLNLGDLYRGLFLLRAVGLRRRWSRISV